MHVIGIDHINISGPASLIEDCRRFYVTILGLRDGPRPPFRFPGHWLYAGDHAVVHLSEKERTTTVRTDTPFDHCALACTGLDEALARLREHGVEHVIKHVPGSAVAQIFVKDPGGLALELTFREEG